jgi:tellurite resistance protein TerB
MGIFNDLFSKAKNAGKKITNKNLMEAIVAGAMLVAAADGDIEDSELSKLEKLLKNNDALSGFSPAEIGAVMTRYAGLLETSFIVGRRSMLKEIEDIAHDADQAEEVFVNMVAIAEADGEIEPAELKVLKDVAQRLRINIAEYGL